MHRKQTSNAVKTYLSHCNNLQIPLIIFYKALLTLDNKFSNKCNLPGTSNAVNSVYLLENCHTFSHRILEMGFLFRINLFLA